MTPAKKPASAKAKKRRLYESTVEETTPAVESTLPAVVEKDNDTVEGAVTVCTKEDHSEQANSIITRNVLLSLAAGIIPIPMVDGAVVSAVQVKMIHELSEAYEVEFQKDGTKAIVTALIAGLGSTFTAQLVASRAFKMIPGIGPFLSLMTAPALAGAATYAVGKVFVKHYEMGGTFLSFDPEEVKEYFAKQFKEGLLVVENIRKPKKA